MPSLDSLNCRRSLDVNGKTYDVYPNREKTLQPTS